MVSGLRLALCATIVLTGCTASEVRPAPAPPAAVAAPDLSAYRLGIGDKVRIDVFGEPDLTMEATVDPTGRISYPLLGSLEALRKTARALQDDITAGLGAGYLKNPDVRVTVVQYRAFYVIGQVQRAGAYPFVIGLTVEKALALAGGMTNLASTRRIYLLHEDEPAGKRLRVSLDALVLPGDTLLVEESLF
jgi:protein involved in polysaccharide export with SLBB domain